jgi:hypothetical protein
MSDANRTDRDDDAGGHTVASQPLVQEETGDQRGEHHAGLAESRHRPHRAEGHGKDDHPVRDK